MRNQLMIPALLALSVGLAACSTKPNVNLEQARSNFSTLQSDPKAIKVAALETKDAGEFLEKAEKAYREKEDQKIVDQLSYLANQRVEVARQTIALRTTEQDLQKTAAQRTQARLEAREAQIKQLQSSLNGKKTERGTLVTFGDVLFDVGRAELKAGGLHNINQLAEFLRDNPGRKVLVEGYTDSTGSEALNLDLSDRRANAVRTALVRMGVGPERIVAQGYGKEYPVASNASASGRAMNRRVEVTISNDNKAVAPRSSFRSY
ncbi:MULTISPECIES: OmpA family protein [Pseudomonas]|uniref:Membrane protein n=2 Tax=Pseudomonadaceae TaxID=135621 RepID=A0A0D0L6A1_9PSED|nr:MULTISPECIES: OmpA family protein [Pseudomonas]KIQ06572.1 membrane protein [Pseudomonas fulva]MCW2291151.1 outer membrane protein OmpA-like peptidoglycan-associated protein [Pseudomonas sp. BIGb0408]NYH74278.1 outer membrane protein OmpA-like peptidoglycan-associated protein [Pseudomonas flavescens]